MLRELGLKPVNAAVLSKDYVYNKNSVHLIVSTRNSENALRLSYSNVEFMSPKDKLIFKII